MKLLVSTVAPYPWVKLNKRGKPVDRGQFIEPAFFNTIPREVSSVVGIAPAQSTTFYQLEVPTKKRSNLLAAIPFALEESLSEEIDELHFTVLDWAPERPAQVAVISRQTLMSWLETFAEAGIKLDAIYPECTLLPIHPDCDATLVKQGADLFTLKTGPYQGYVCDQDAFEYWWSDVENQQLRLGVSDQAFAGHLIEQGGAQVSHWDIGEDFRSWVEHRHGQLKTAVSLLHSEFEPEHLKPGSNWLNVAAGLAMFALILMGGSHWVEAGKLQKRYDANQQAIRALFDEAFPDQEYLGQPRRQIASLLSISEDDPADEVFQYLLSVSAEVAPLNNAQLDEINYRDRQLQIGVSVPNFAALESLTNQINSLEGVQALLISSGARDQLVTGQIKIAQAN